MPQTENIKTWRAIFFYLLPPSFLTIIFAYTFPSDATAFLRFLSPDKLLFGIPTFWGGIVLIIDALEVYSKIQKHSTARAVVYFTATLGFGLIAFGFAILAGLFNPLQDAMSGLKIFWMILIGFSMFFFYVHAVPPLLSRKQLAEKLKEMV